MPDHLWRCFIIIRKNYRYIGIGAICVALLALAYFYQDSENGFEDGKIKRNEPGEGGQQYELIVGGEGLEKDYRYQFQVDEKKLTEAECMEYIHRAEAEIDDSFYCDGENAEHVSSQVNIKKVYADELVTAEWFFSNSQLVAEDGTLQTDELAAAGEIVTAEVELTCDEVKEMYSFSFHAYPKKLTGSEYIINEINRSISRENEKVGESYVTLPSKIGDSALTWNKPKEYLVVKVLFLEIGGLILLVFADRKQKREDIRKLKDKMRLDYADVVSKMAILLGSGMSVKQSWNKIASRAADGIYGEMRLTIREMEDGISERVAYQNFGERIGLDEYYRFVRLLVSNMQKGNRSICMALEEEAISAYEQRRLLAKKLGEEVGTKMLIPLMIMLIIVMAIIMIPAILEFKM